MANPNFLILDEPTNDFDIQTIQVLEDFLLDYPGCLLVVSHDRYLMDKLVDHLFVFEGGGQIRYYPGTYSEYWLDQQQIQKQARSEKPKAEAPVRVRSNTSKKLSFKEQREFDQLEGEIERLGIEKDGISAQLANSAGLEAGALQRLSTRFGELEAELEDKELRWLELAEKQEG